MPQIGNRNHTAIGALVERASGLVTLVALPEACAASVTWEQPEMRDWQQVQMEPGIDDVYFCDPLAHWRCGTNETPTAYSGEHFPRASTSPPSRADLASPNLNAWPPRAFHFATPTEQI